MIDIIYVERAILDHERSQRILRRFPSASIIECERYGEVFNPKAQNFRLQKQRPALILAEKHQRRVLPAPQGYAIGADHNYYFSHMLNCLYDCRYCFLQGMYQSANYVCFVNYEDFRDDIRRICAQTPEQAIHFFSGYDCDSLAFEPVTAFGEEFLPWFEALPNAWLELRTKSTQIRHLLARPTMPRCVVAFSLAPDPVAQQVEAKAPPLGKRLEAAARLQQQGWSIGLRFDPIIDQPAFKQIYSRFFQQVFETIDGRRLHSVSLGVFRLPESYFKKIHKLYPEAALLASARCLEDGLVSYGRERQLTMMDDCRTMLLNYIPESILYPCTL
jgi:spore photoproduct lyase